MFGIECLVILSLIGWKWLLTEDYSPFWKIFGRNIFPLTLWIIFSSEFREVSTLLKN